jgi:hypothetical protein
MRIDTGYLLRRESVQAGQGTAEQENPGQDTRTSLSTIITPTADEMASGDAYPLDAASEEYNALRKKVAG